MGCAESHDAIERDVDLTGMPDNFTKKEFQKIRGNGTCDAAIKQFQKIGGVFVNDVSPASIGTRFEKVCFLCVNTYTKEQYKLGPGPLNDALTVAENHHRMGYAIYYMHNGTPKVFLDFLEHFLQKTKTALTVFFTGHGASVPDKNGDESDGFDEAMVFDTGHIIDDQLAEYLQKYATGTCHTILLTDCCHSGSIWDIQSCKRAKIKLPPHIMSLSAAKDSQTAKQAKIGQKDQGIFTHYFWKLVNEQPKITAKQMESKLNPLIAKFKQHFTIASTSSDMETKPIFP